MATFTWGLPGISLDPPPLRDGQVFPAFPPAWNRLVFGPVGLYELRRKLGVHAAEPGVFQRYRHRFLTADIAWFAAGASTDGQHRIGQPGFFPALELLRRPLVTGPEGSQVRRALSDQMQVALWDMATTWDRAFGGTTMIMHIDGTTRPNTPAEPQYLRAPTYLPPAFVAAHPDSHAPIARIVQTFIEAVGVPTVEQWRLNAQRLNWSLTQAGMSGSVNTPSNQLIPPPRPNSSLYHFFGRHPGTLDTLLASPPSSSRPAILIDDDDDYDNNLDETSFALMDLLERASYAEEQAAQRLIRINELEEQVNVLSNQVNAARRAAPSAPTTPARLRATPQRTPQRGGPPPYSPSANPRSPLALSPDRSRAEISPGDDRLDTFIEVHGLGDHAVAIKLVIRVFSPVKWYEELANLGIPAAVISSLLDLYH
ncbi:hypothetical protein C8F04DRAFT_1253820 [Mycena alexandri]|uniref:Uncharacterized protein n=1 Tax=Mycena alexandri TaxID=1745969 RepID=A0AAD6T9Y6_9AGAR|nr:hypothetical protein C8F04DRAFT_1253820 [Mycena alexandri]